MKKFLSFILLLALSVSAQANRSYRICCVEGKIISGIETIDENIKFTFEQTETLNYKSMQFPKGTILEITTNKNEFTKVFKAQNGESIVIEIRRRSPESGPEETFHAIQVSSDLPLIEAVNTLYKKNVAIKQAIALNKDHCKNYEQIVDFRNTYTKIASEFASKADQRIIYKNEEGKFIKSSISNFESLYKNENCI